MAGRRHSTHFHDGSSSDVGQSDCVPLFNPLHIHHLMADRTSVLVVEHLISFVHATAILKKFKQKKHAKMGYFFELTDLGMNIWDTRINKTFDYLKKAGNDLPPRYGDYPGGTAGWHLKVYRDLA